MTDAAPTDVPVIERNGRPFAIRLRDIPQPWQDRFRTALRGSACPVIGGEGHCAYVWDWQDWLQGRFPRSGRPRSEKSDRLGRFITSKEFIERANRAVGKAIAELEAKGVRPVYIERIGDN